MGECDQIAAIGNVIILRERRFRAGAKQKRSGSIQSLSENAKSVSSLGLAGVKRSETLLLVVWLMPRVAKLSAKPQHFPYL